MKQLRTNTSIHILQADKGNATVIVDKTNYNNKIQELLNTGTYAKLQKDPTPAIERRFNQKLLALHKNNILSKPLYFKLRSSSATCPILFGQPKIHKPTILLPLIVSTRGSPTYNTVQHLATILQPLVSQSCHHVINSRQNQQHQHQPNRPPGQLRRRVPLHQRSCNLSLRHHQD